MTVGNQGSRPVRGGTDLFPTTLWGDIREAQGRSTPALTRLCERYREPLFIYLQRRGLDYHNASDLVQGFFAHLLEREFLVGLEPGKGRFRAFLLQSLQNFLADQWDEANAWKRGGRVRHVPLTSDIADVERPGAAVDPGVTPDQAYQRAWAQTVLRNALANWRRDQTGRANGTLPAEVLEELLYADPDAPSYGELSVRHGVKRGALEMMVYRLRLRLGYWIREEIRRTLAPGESVDEELRYLVRILRGG